MRVAAIGDNCLDVYVEQDLLTVGGNALNVAVNWARAGLDSQYFGAVGDDDAADAVRNGAKDVGLDPASIVGLEGRTGVTLIRLVESNREFLHEEFGVGVDWRPGDDVLDSVEGVDWVHHAGVSRDARLTSRLAERGHRFSVDLSTYHDFDRLDGVEIAFASIDGEADNPAHDLAARICDAGAAVAVIMRGEHGSLVRAGHETTTTKAQPIKPVDTCGAGDSFIAAYVKSHLQGNAPQLSLVQATASATATCLHIGGFPQPTLSVPDWLKAAYYQFAASSPA
ncbi:PfkB family carbohydrate kinase [Ruicaihuangia caeni]|uniref:PfkB family carbohydrate kinase n=1 Tax=Ruicaihuangia caeni TaxID=3042517 RepID=A0AAW6TBI7_9MICO|nr:PfkB family carbohydrate kinase [Klugiella sp. YN-L-19]MDI2099213.1 PfkB family carbohydrate kinase [Klugiella sp. YN-L-19]